MEQENSHVEDHNAEPLTTNQIKQKAQVSFQLSTFVLIVFTRYSYLMAEYSMSY